MSLTSLITHDKELRDKIRHSFSRPKLDKTKPLLAEPHTKRYTLMGVAFDYILRFYLENINSNCIKPDKWIAEHAIDLLKHDKKTYKKGIEIINQVKELKDDFFKTNEISKELIRQTIRMSYIDPVFRSGMGAEYIGTDAEEADIEDITKLISLLDKDLFSSKDICLLNPTFGDASRLVGGADADFIIDDKLIDIKTTKSLDLKLDDFCQVIGYYSLNKLDKSSELEINKLGIYYSRFGYLLLFNINDLISEKSLAEFIEWFKDRIHQTSKNKTIRNILLD
jgi:hypothetical protein